MNRVYALTLALGVCLVIAGCDEAADLVREQQSKALQQAKDAARTELDKGRNAVSESVGDALTKDKEEDEASKGLKDEEK